MTIAGFDRPDDNEVTPDYMIWDYEREDYERCTVPNCKNALCASFTCRFCGRPLATDWCTSCDGPFDIYEDEEYGLYDS